MARARAGIASIPGPTSPWSIWPLTPVASVITATRARHVGDENPGWQRDFDVAKQGGGPSTCIPSDAFTIARAPVRAEQRACAASGKHLRVQQRGARAAELRGAASLRPESGRHLRPGTSSSPAWARPFGPALIQTDEGQQFNQSAGIAQWNGWTVRRCCGWPGRLGIWDNRNVEPVRYWREVTKVEENIPVAAAASRGVIYENNCAGHLDPVTRTTFGCRRRPLATAATTAPCSSTTP